MFQGRTVEDWRDACRIAERRLGEHRERRRELFGEPVSYVEAIEVEEQMLEAAVEHAWAGYRGASRNAREHGIGLDPPRPHGGPRPMVAEAEVLRARRELEEQGLPWGERSIAKVLGVSRDAVRHALGKPRQRKD